MFSIDSEREIRVKRYFDWICKMQPNRTNQYMIDIGISKFRHWEATKDNKISEDMEDCFQVAEMMMRNGK